MEKPDCLIIDISSSKVCPMCNNSVCEKDMAKTCKKNISDHNVCIDCEASLKKHGFGGGCTFCGHRSEQQQNIVITRSPNPRMSTHTIVIQNNHRFSYFTFNCRRHDFCALFCLCILIIMIILALYIIGNIVFSIGQLIIHKINKEDHTHEMELSLTNCIIGYLGWLCVAYIILQIALLIDVFYEKCCFPCWNRSGSCFKMVKSCCFCISYPLQSTTNRENHEFNHQRNRVFVSG